MSVSIRTGSRMPLYATSMGRVLLAGQTQAWRDAYFDRTPLRALTENTVTDRLALEQIIAQVGQRGHAVVDQELEGGLRSVAVPVIERGRVIAALNIGTQAARVSTGELETRCLPTLRRLAEMLSATG